MNSKMSILEEKQSTSRINGYSTCSFIITVGLIMMLVSLGILLETPYRPHPVIETTQTQLLSSNQNVCVEKTRVAFIKVHKAASTTITSIIQRYGLNHNLTFALPRKSDLYHIGFFETFDPANVRQLPKGKVYEALCQHVVYNREAFQKYLPRNMKIIAAVREPFSRFVSAFQYFGEYHQTVRSRAHISGNSVALMREFLKNPEYYEPHDFKQGSLAYNRMAFDLGLPKAQYSNSTFVDQYIRQLDEDMSLVLIAEYFDQSLVLLKRIMCWSTKDILYQVRHKGRGKPEIPQDLKITHRQLAPAEYHIYEYFRTKFITIYSKEVDIDEEVEVYKETHNKVNKFCSSRSKRLVVQPTKFDNGFTFTQRDCYFMRLEETSFVKYLSKLQEP